MNLSVQQACSVLSYLRGKLINLISAKEMDNITILVIFALIFCIDNAATTCTVLTNCNNGEEQVIKWKAVSGDSVGRPGKRGAPGEKGARGEPGEGLDTNEPKDEGPKLYFLANTITWEIGMNFCTSLGKRLCHSTDLCTTDSEGGQHFIPDVVPNDNWVPISDESNEWLQNGDSAARTCWVHEPTHGYKAVWGTSTKAAPHKGYVYCCTPKQRGYNSLSNMRYRFIGKSANYQNSKTHCEEIGMRLCSSTEVCTNSTPKFGKISKDSWVAVNDRVNEWIQTSNAGTCSIHGVRYSAPAWGLRTSGLLDSVGYVYCCT